ncbi:MAG: phenylalanine--tRNA ligase subunit alpha [Nitrososphaerota archaeon]|nr:phenylalanine--tRNA ligase subunit alpha [Candidatus Bathyarchaeota archaeon]MDW8193644.1 phenylalanine--tRNA ligase subunit alpha [Nitrososphaerota archaeon]
MGELRINDRKTLVALKELGGRASVEDIARKSGLAHSAVMRSALVLSSEEIVMIHERKHLAASLNSEGKGYAEMGLPERRIVRCLLKLGGEADIGRLAEEAKMDPEIVPIALGWLKSKGWAEIKGKRCILTLNCEPPKGVDEELLELINEKGKVVVDELSPELKRALEVIKKRKLVEVEETVHRELELTAKGWNLVNKGIKIVEEVTQLTPELIISGKWRSVKLTRFDVKASAPVVYPGKEHPLQQIIKRAREIFLEMGFTEIRGPIVETAFWNFDALFQPQDHPAREMADTFYMANPRIGRLPGRKIVDGVAMVHENGWITGSKGWGYRWSSEEAMKLVLRTHTTAETIKYLATHKRPPIKVFSVDRVYRNEQVTYKNIAEFHQIEGIVVDKKVTLRDLMGTLKTFYKKFGLEKIEFWPSYFPYTEPSAQAMVFHPKLNRWIELCGMGMFRPEVLAPMGIKCPVLAWGGGLERLAMIELGLNDIRLLYANNLGWLRRTPLCQ